LTFFLYVSIFAIGWFSHALFSHIHSLGSSVILLKAVLAETLMFVAFLVQDVYEIQELKRYELRNSGKTEAQMEFQKKIDEKEINIYKNKIVRTIKSNFPQSFSNLITFNNWETLLQSIEQQTKERR
jgi:hypothetical protein